MLIDGEKLETKQKRLEEKYASLQIVNNVEKLGTVKVIKNVTFFL
jgi:cytoplasmic FMR1 interacting protein